MHKASDFAPLSAAMDRTIVPEDRREYMDRTIGSGPDKTLTLMIQVQHPDADDL